MSARRRKPLTLAIDIGGTHVKAMVLDATGKGIADEVRIATPRPARPKAMLEAIAGLAEELPAFDRISAGFPGYIRNGIVRTAPNLGTDSWRGYDLAAALAKRFGKRARVLNDADVQGLGVIEGKGLECVLTLGTGIGSSLFLNGRLLPHLELGQHPLAKHRTYDQYIGDAVLKRIGREKWNRRLAWTITVVETFFNYDVLHLGGGNAARVRLPLPKKVKLAPNVGGLTGGIRLWDKALDEVFRRAAR